MSIHVFAFSAGAAVVYGIYRYAFQNLTKDKGVSVERLARDMVLERCDVAVLVDAEITAEMADIIGAAGDSGDSVCLLYLVPPSAPVPQAREVHLLTDGETHPNGGIIVEGDKDHRDTVVMALFANIDATTHVVLDAPDRATRWMSRGVDHMTTAVELRDLLLSDRFESVGGDPSGPDGPDGPNGPNDSAV